MERFENNNIALCSLCNTIYNTPRMLPCQHTFCENCLSDFVQKHATKRKKSSSHFPCPSCKRRTKLAATTEDENNASQFPINLTMQAMLESEPVMKKMKKMLRKRKVGEITTKTDNKAITETKGKDGTRTVPTVGDRGVNHVRHMVNNKPTIEVYLIPDEDMNMLAWNVSQLTFVFNRISIYFGLTFLIVSMAQLAYWFPKLFLLVLILDTGRTTRRLESVRIYEDLGLWPKRGILNMLLCMICEWIFVSCGIIVTLWVLFLGFNDSYLILYNGITFVNHELTDGYNQICYMTVYAMFSVIMNEQHVKQTRNRVFQLTLTSIKT